MSPLLLLALGLLPAAGAKAQATLPPVPGLPAALVAPGDPQAPVDAEGPGRDLTSRRATLKVTAVADTDATLQGWTQAGGLRAYGVIVPPGGKVRVRLRHATEGRFRIARTWMHNLGYHPDPCLSGDPMNCFNNATGQALDVYFVVRDPGHWANEKAPYTLEFTRSWKPGADTGGVKLRDQIRFRY